MPTPPPIATLSAREARRAALAAQGLLGPRDRGGVVAMLSRLRGVQIDTISVLARSHELVAYARLGALGRDKVEAAYWGPRSATFEYWSHAACILPLEDWPHYAFQRRARRARGHRWHFLEDAARTCAGVVDRLRAEGPLTANQLGGAKRGGPWWDWSEVKIAAEWLLDTGDLVCRERRGFQRVYDLAERAIPEALLAEEPEDGACHRHLVRSAGRALGVATTADLAAYHGVHRRHVELVVADAGLLPVEVEGWAQPAYADPAVLELLGRRLAGRTTLVSPFDSLTWDRARTERLFAMALRLEAYTPRSKRVFGYFAMPVLAGDRLIARVDPARDGGALVARHVAFEGRGGTAEVARALVDAARWVGLSGVVVERVTPPERAGELRALVAARS